MIDEIQNCLWTHSGSLSSRFTILLVDWSDWVKVKLKRNHIVDPKRAWIVREKKKSRNNYQFYSVINYEYKWVWVSRWCWVVFLVKLVWMFSFFSKGTNIMLVATIILHICYRYSCGINPTFPVTIYYLNLHYISRKILFRLFHTMKLVF